MTEWANTLAKEFKKRNNQEYFGAIIGVLLSINPLKIGIYDNEIMLDKNNSFICKTINDMLINGTLIINDKVLVISSENNQTFFISDKIFEIT